MEESHLNENNVLHALSLVGRRERRHLQNKIHMELLFHLISSAMLSPIQNATRWIKAMDRLATFVSEEGKVAEKLLNCYITRGSNGI